MYNFAGSNTSKYRIARAVKWMALMLCVGSLPFGYSVVAQAAQITFNFTYDDQVDSTGVGFDDAKNGAAARGALQAEANYIASVLAVNVNRTVNIEVLDSPTANGDSNLATANVQYGPDPGKAMFLPTSAQSIIQTGVNPATKAATLEFNFAADTPWQFGTTVDNTHFDFRSTALHELSHHLGWASVIESDGSGIGTSSLVYGVYDQFVSSYNGTNYVKFVTTDGSGKPTGHQAAAQLIDVAHHLKFDGPFSSDEGGPFDLTTLNPFKDGSSVSHFSNLVDVMGDSSAMGQGAQIYSPADMSVLKDLGYQLSVPEPGSLTLVALGVATIVGAQRLRRFRGR